MSVSAGRSEPYRPEIDGLRGISILAVVLYHARVPGFGAGYLGVDVFFVISGFLITGQLLREAESTGTIQMAMFYARRVRRLIPAFVVMAIGTTALALVYLLPMTEQRLFGNALTRSAFFYYNIAVWRGGYAYDGEPADQQVLMHTWSLGVEEQFYLVWPFICLAVLRLRHPLAGFSIVALASLTASWWFLPVDADAVFFLLPFRAWELALGACVAAGRWKALSSSAGGGALIGACLVALGLASGAPRQVGLLPQLPVVLGAVLVVAFGATPNPSSSFLRTAPMVFLGRMSYAWYLWHWPILVIGRLVTSFEEHPFEGGLLALGLAVAALTFLGVERPLRRIQILKPAPIVAIGVSALAAVASLGKVIEVRSKMWTADPANARRISILTGRSARPCEKDFATLGCDLLTKSSADRASLLLWGDSFAWALSPALEEYSRTSGVSVRLLFESSCPPLLGVVPGNWKAPSKPDPVCEDDVRAVQEQLWGGRSGISGLVLAARWPFYVSGDLSGPFRGMYEWGGRPIEGSRAITRGLEATLDLAESIDVRVLIVGVPPDFPFAVPLCLWRSPSHCSVDRSWNEAARDLAGRSIEEAIRGRRNVRFANLFDPLCPGQRCSAGAVEEPLLLDRTHLSPVAAEKRVLPILIGHLEWLRGLEAAEPLGGGRQE